MKQQKKWFTLVELTISIFIMSIIIIGISLSLIKISQNFSDTHFKTDIFQQVNEFHFDTAMFKYNSWIIFTGWILLYDDTKTKWFLIGSFVDKNNGYNYSFEYDQNEYNSYYFWYFLLDENALLEILNGTISIQDRVYNNGKIYKNLIIKDISISTYNSGTIFEIYLEIFKKYQDNFIGKKKTDIFLPDTEYVKFNFNF